MSTTSSYKAREFSLSRLNGISDETLEMHFKLYEGYVKGTNTLTERIGEFLADGKIDQEEPIGPSPTSDWALPFPTCPTRPPRERAGRLPRVRRARSPGGRRGCDA